MKAFVLLIASLMSFSLFAKETRNFSVPRGECLMLPKILNLNQMIRGVHYSVEREPFADCSEDRQGNIKFETCKDQVTIFFHYRYTKETMTEHYTAEGRLFTTSVTKVPENLIEIVVASTVGEWAYGKDSHIPLDEAAKELVEESYNEAQEAILTSINKELYKSVYGACKDSYYK